MIKRIDPHVHFRDGQQAYKETIAHGLTVAAAQGVYAVFDMPNTDPPIMRKVRVDERLALVPKGEEDRYFLYIGASADADQLIEAATCWDDYKQIIGIKLFAGQSVGRLGVVTEEEQRKVYRTLAQTNYTGVLAVHCEKESKMKEREWDPLKPYTHCRARPKEAEIESVKDQIKFANENGFKGTLHICHVSCAESVGLVKNARRRMKITCGVTPHHILWNEGNMRQPDGMLYKMNPPLRAEEDVRALRICLKNGDIDWIETDHAPHAVGEKLFPPYMSGYPSLYIYKDLLSILKVKGMKEAQIDDMTYHNIVKAFGHKLK
jgi:dihydroorotase